MIKIALFEPEIAGNVGTIMRTCACLGIELHIIEPCGFVFDMKKIKKSALDYIDHVKLFRHNCFGSFYDSQIIQRANSRLVLLTTKAEDSYTNFEFRENDILLFGKESAGVSKEIYDTSCFKIKIPMNEKMRSINLAVAVGILLGKVGACV